MPWKKVTQMEEKMRFVSLVQTDRFTISSLCEQFGISRKTGHKWLERYREGGMEGLGERSHRPHRFPGITEEGVRERVLEERRLHPTWGPKKLREVLRVKHGMEAVPAVSTIGKLLSQQGLSVRPRRKPGLYRPSPSEFTEAKQPNHVWTVDFKGWFLMGDGQRCDPLTIKDLFSHYMIEVRALPNQQFKGTYLTFRRLAQDVGLPAVIRVDHGAPFSSVGLGRLSALSVWWIEQGIEVEFTRPASPQDNGSHERMHRDLKAEATQPAQADLRSQQQAFDRWRRTFNHERPHEAIGMRRPFELYRPSERKVDQSRNPVVYPKDYHIKTVSQSGFIFYDGHNYPIGEAFIGKKIGLRTMPDGQTEVYFANVHLGNLRFDAEGGRFKASAYVGRPLVPDASVIPASHALLENPS